MATQSYLFAGPGPLKQPVPKSDLNMYTITHFTLVVSGRAPSVRGKQETSTDIRLDSFLPWKIGLSLFI